MFLETKSKFGFEYFVLQDRKRNPYFQGFLKSIAEANEVNKRSPNDPLTPGPVTDAYCEDMLKYRGLDLKPTICEPEPALKWKKDISAHNFEKRIADNAY
jgi:hypothetical protein